MEIDMCCGLLENSGFFGIGKIVLNRYGKEFWYISIKYDMSSLF